METNLARVEGTIPRYGMRFLTTAVAAKHFKLSYRTRGSGVCISNVFGESPLALGWSRWPPCSRSTSTNWKKNSFLINWYCRMVKFPLKSRTDFILSGSKGAYIKTLKRSPSKPPILEPFNPFLLWLRPNSRGYALSVIRSEKFPTEENQNLLRG